MEKAPLPSAAFELDISPAPGKSAAVFLKDSEGRAAASLSFEGGAVVFAGEGGEKPLLHFEEGARLRAFWEVFPEEGTCRVQVWDTRASRPPASATACMAPLARFEVRGEADVRLREGLAPVGQKEGGTLYRECHTQAARANARRFSWAAAMEKAISAQAEYWMGLSYEQLWDKMFQPNTAKRSLMVWSDGHCPCCGEKIGMYAWKTDPKEHPWKVFCPSCGEKFPKNDFWAFHASGVDPRTGLFDRARADEALLFNAEHPDPADPLHMFGVDDGGGCTDGENRWYFVGYYLYRGAWYQDILEGVNRLSEAYLVTGDGACAARVLILLDRIADFFPEFEYFSQGLVYEKPTVTGYVTYCIDSAYDVLHMALAYDRVFASAKRDGSAAAFLAGMAAKFPENPVYRENPKKTFSQIQKNIETRIFRHALAHADRIRTNYPSTDLTIVTVRAVLGWPGQAEAVQEKIAMLAKTATFADGTAGEKGLPNYTAFPAQRLARFLAEFSRVSDGFLKDLIEKCPTLAETWRFFAETMCLDGFYPHTGDAGDFARGEGAYRGMALWSGEDAEGIFRVSPIPSLHALLWRLYEITGDVTYVKIMYRENGDRAEGLPLDLLSGENEAVERAVTRLIEAHGRDFAFGSVDKTGYHIALLRAKNDESPVFWLVYDSGGQFGHSHKSGMNLGLFAFGEDLITDFGYPPVNRDGWQGPWTAWYQGTFSHNTVVVDLKNQRPAEGKTVFFHGEGPARAFCAAAAEMYENTEKYERTLVQVDTAGKSCYVADVFRVSGGIRHDRFLSTRYAGLSVGGLSLQEAENPWAAEPACAVCVSNVRCDRRPEEGFYADFQIEDEFGNPTALHVRQTEFTRGAEAFVFDAWVQKSFSDPQEGKIPRIAACRRGEEGLVSAFVAVIEPYEGEPEIAGIRRLPLTDGEDIALSDEFAAIEVTLKTGETDLIVSNASPGRTVRQPDWRVSTAAALQVLRKKDGKIETLLDICM